MVTLSLTDEQAAFLDYLLREEETELGEEIRHTDSRDYKEALKMRRDLIHSMDALLHPASA